MLVDSMTSGKLLCAVKRMHEDLKDFTLCSSEASEVASRVVVRFSRFYNSLCDFHSGAPNVNFWKISVRKTI